MFSLNSLIVYLDPSVLEIISAIFSDEPLKSILNWPILFVNDLSDIFPFEFNKSVTTFNLL